MPFRTALSGLNAASADLRVIGNNVANAGTTGFKKSRVEFGDIYPRGTLGAARTAIGNGVRLAAVAQDFNKGNPIPTGNNLDLAINGQGFFRLDDNGTIVYSRAGAFHPDSAGYIINNQNQRLTAYVADANGNITGAVAPLQLSYAHVAPRETDQVTLLVNLDSRVGTLPVAGFNANDPTTYHLSRSFEVYDSLGNPRLATLYFVHTGPGAWSLLGAVDGVQIDMDAGAAGNDRVLTFDGGGQLTSPNQATTGLIPGTGGSLPFDMTIDLAGTTQYGDEFATNGLVQDGYASGRLSGLDISDNGIVQANYTNGQARVLGQLALASFANPQGLQQLGDANWAETFESGAALVGPPGTSGIGWIDSGFLEGSNVDLTEQLVNMITAQRNYQANAQVIATADAITQTIINIR